MTPVEAKKLVTLAIGATVARDMDRETLLFLQSHLLPLPYAAVAPRIHRHAAHAKWCTCLAELLDACDLPARARDDLVRAVDQGGRVVPDLRSATGWSYVAPGEPLPRGAVEAAAVAAEPAAPPAGPPALPPGPAVIRGVLLDRDRRIAALIGAKRVPGPDRPQPGAPTPPPDPATVEAELAAFDARYRAQQTAPETAKEKSRA
jgi:hypothetical protein